MGVRIYSTVARACSSLGGLNVTLVLQSCEHPPCTHPREAGRTGSPVRPSVYRLGPTRFLFFISTFAQVTFTLLQSDTPLAPVINDRSFTRFLFLILTLLLVTFMLLHLWHSLYTSSQLQDPRSLLFFILTFHKNLTLITFLDRSSFPPRPSSIPRTTTTNLPQITPRL